MFFRREMQNTISKKKMLTTQVYCGILLYHWELWLSPKRWRGGSRWGWGVAEGQRNRERIVLHIDSMGKYQISRCEVWFSLSLYRT
jgi:hypothetical protein